MEATKLSVCLPTCNGERFLAETIRSILSQTFDDLEVILVDDCSTDRTLDIVSAVADPRLTVYRNDARLGIPGNWNRGLGLAKGEYVCVFHQDDLMQPDNLARKVAALDADPAVGLVHSGVEVRREEGAPDFYAAWLEQSPTDFVLDGLAYFHRLLFRGNRICAPTVVARRERLLQLGGFNEHLHFACDYELWMKVAVDARVAYLSSPLVVYRWHAGNATHEFRFERGFEETRTAARNALRYYGERAGAGAEAALLAEALEALEESRAWAIQLDRGRVWLEAQVQRWQEEFERQREYLGRVIKGLEERGGWLETERAGWERATLEREEYLKYLEAALPFRVFARLGLVRRRSAAASPDSAT